MVGAGFTNTWSFTGSGWESFSRGPLHWIRGWGSDHGIYPWGNALVMGMFDRGAFWVGCEWVFLGALVGGGLGWGRGNTRARSVGSFFAGRHSFSNRPIFYVICYILSSGGFAASCFKTIVNGVGGLGIRMSTIDTKTDVRRGSGAPSTDGPGA